MTTAANVLETRDVTATPAWRAKIPMALPMTLTAFMAMEIFMMAFVFPYLPRPPHAPLLRIFPLHGAAHKQGQIQNYRIRPCFHKFRSIIAVEYSIKCITHFLFLRNMLF